LECPDLGDPSVKRGKLDQAVTKHLLALKG